MAPTKSTKQNKSIKRKNTKKNKTAKANTKPKSNTKPKTKTKRTKPQQKSQLVLVYADWCPHCQTMKPEWNEMKNRLGADVETMEIEDSDFDKDMKLKTLEEQKLNGEHLEIYGYPTLFKIQNGRADYYGGNRTADAMTEWAKTTYGGYIKSKLRASNRSIRSKSR